MQMANDPEWQATPSEAESLEERNSEGENYADAQGWPDTLEEFHPKAFEKKHQAESQSIYEKFLAGATKGQIKGLKVDTDRTITLLNLNKDTKGKEEKKNLLQKKFEE